MSDSNETPEAIAAGIEKGDKNAERALIEKYQKILYFVLSNRTRDPELAKDLVQDTFVIVLEKLRNNSLEDPSKLAAYLQSTAINLYIGEVRKSERRKTSADTELIESVSENEGDQYRRVLQEQARIAVRKHIAELPQERDRKILHRYYLEEKDKEEVCSELDLDHRHFDRVISRARTRFKELVDEGMKDLMLNH